MNLLLDSSSIINLFNAEALDLVSGLTRCRFWLPPMVISECQVGSAAAILELQAQGSVGFLDDDIVPTEDFLALLEEHDLGDGETECIAICRINGYSLCCDDKKARELARNVLGADRVVGTIRLFRWCVEDSLLNCAQAFDLFRLMRSSGGFLPATSQEFFCSGAD